MRKVAQFLVTVSLFPFMLIGALAHHIVVGCVAGYNAANDATSDLMED